MYGDFVHELDWIVGEVMRTLEEQGVADNTLVIFTSDNGGMFNLGGQQAFKMGHRGNGDLLGFKFGAWEGGHRVPMIARWPGKIQPGTKSAQLISGVDMLATFAALTRQDLNKEQRADSINMLPALTGDPETPLRETLVFSPHRPSHLAVRKGKWVYINARGSGGFSGGPGKHGAGGAVCASFVGNVNSDFEQGKYKADAPPAQLYDLDADVNQSENLYKQYPEVVKEMKALLASYAPPKQKKNEKQKKPRPQDTKPKAPETEKQGAAIGSAPKTAVSTKTTPDSEASKPNFVIIFTDDQGYGDLGCFGATHVNTPRIDQMAAEGAQLTSFYVAAPVCTPSRAALMTGCYPKRIDMATGSNLAVLLAGDRKGLNPDEITIAEVLKTAGYHTGMFGKWHLGDQPQFLPTRQGFDEFFGLPYSHDIHPFHPNQKKYNFPALPLLEGETVVELDPDADYLTQRFTERAVPIYRRPSIGTLLPLPPAPHSAPTIACVSILHEKCSQRRRDSVEQRRSCRLRHTRQDLQASRQ